VFRITWLGGPFSRIVILDLSSGSFILSVTWRGSQRIFYSHTVLTQKSHWAPCGSLRTSSSSSNIRSVGSAHPSVISTLFPYLCRPLVENNRIIFCSHCFFGDRFFRASGGGLKVQCSLWPPTQMQWNHATQGQSCEELVPNRHPTS
jgi:hypothetical protein